MFGGEKAKHQSWCQTDLRVLQTNRAANLASRHLHVVSVSLRWMAALAASATLHLQVPCSHTFAGSTTRHVQGPKQPKQLRRGDWHLLLRACPAVSILASKRLRRGGHRQAEEACRFLVPRLVEAMNNKEVAHSASTAFIQEAAAVVDDMLLSPGPRRKEFLDGLADMRRPGRCESPARTRRKRVHQALHNLCRYLLDDTERLDSLASVG